MKTKSPSSTSSSEHGADREGLIGLPRPDAPRTATGLRWGVSLAFLFVLGATAVCDTLFPAPRPRMALHQELDYEAMRERANLRDGSAARLVEYELRLRSRVRRALAKPYSTFLYEVLGETPHNVIRGDDDWLFMRERVIPPARSTERVASLGASVVRGLERRVDGLGLPICFAPIPRKSVMHPDRLPRGIDCRPDVDDAVFEALRERGVDTIDLLRTFREDAVEGIYYPCDSHWSAASQVLAAEAMIRHIDRLAPAGRRRTELLRGDAITPPGRTDLLPYMDVALGDERLRELRRQGLHTYDVEPLGGAWPADLAVSRQGGRIAISGTSFTDGKRFSKYLAHYADASVLNGAMSAANFAGALRELLLRRDGFPELEHVLFEFPMHQVFFRPDEDGWIRLPDSYGQLLAENPPANVMPVTVADEFRVAPRFADAAWVEVGGRDPLLVAELPAGALLHSGDGVAALELTGSARGKRPMVEVRIGEVRLRADWPQGAERVVLPLIDEQVGAAAIRIHAHGQRDAAFSLRSVRVVADDPGDRVRVLRLGTAEAREGGWVMRAELEGPLETRRLASLHAGPGAFAASGATELIVRSAAPEAGELRVPLDDLAPTSALVLDLGSLGGRPIESLEVRGTGDAPQHADARLGLLD